MTVKRVRYTLKLVAALDLYKQITLHDFNVNGNADRARLYECLSEAGYVWDDDNRAYVLREQTHPLDKPFVWFALVSDSAHIDELKELASTLVTMWEGKSIHWEEMPPEIMLNLRGIYFEVEK